MARNICVFAVILFALSACAGGAWDAKPNPYGKWTDPNYVPGFRQRTVGVAGFYPGEGQISTSQQMLAEIRIKNAATISDIDVQLKSAAPLWCLDRAVTTCVASFARYFVVFTQRDEILNSVSRDILDRPVSKTVVDSFEVLPAWNGKEAYQFYDLTIMSDATTGLVKNVSLRGNPQEISAFSTAQSIREIGLQNFFEAATPPKCRFVSERDFFRFLADGLFDVEYGQDILFSGSHDAGVASVASGRVSRCGYIFDFSSQSGSSIRNGEYTSGRVGVSRP